MCLNEEAMSAVAGPHGIVHVELQRRLSDTRRRLDRATQRAATLAYAAKTQPLRALAPGAKDAMRSAAAALGVELTPLEKLGAVSDEEAAYVAWFAVSTLEGAQEESARAQRALDQALAALPPCSGHVRADRTKHSRVRAAALARLKALAPRTRLGLATSRIAAAVALPDWLLFEEFAARVAAEDKAISAARALAYSAGALSARAERLKAVMRLGGPRTNLLRQVLVHTTLSDMASQASSVHRFAAFPGARTLPGIAEALVADLKQVGPLQVSAAERITWLADLATVDAPMVSLSACGVLCAGGLIEARELAVAHLPTRRAVVIACDKDWIHGFVYKGELFVGQSSCAVLWHAPVAEVLAGRTDLADFEQMPLAVRWGTAPCLDTAARGFVVIENYIDPTQHLFVDLAARTSRLVATERELPSLGGFTGIVLPGAGWAASTNNYGVENMMYVVAPNGATLQISRGLSPLPTVLPSASAPSDLTRAAVFDQDANFAVGGVRGQLKEPVCPWFQSLLRLYRDVFLCWDLFKKAWLMVRIVVL